MTTTQGQINETGSSRTFPRRYAAIAILSVAAAFLLVAPTRKSYAIKSVIDQCQEQGYTDGMVREVTKLFPDARALMRARELSSPPAPIAAQALSDFDRKALEDRMYAAIVDRFGAEGLELATLLVSYLGQMKFKVVLAVRTKELPYPRIRQTLQRMRTLVEKDVLVETFKGFELAELSSFTVLNRRNGRFYEYPVLYQNMSMPYFTGEEENGPAPRPFARPALPGETGPTSAGSARPRFPWGDRPWEAKRNERGPRDVPPRASDCILGAPAVKDTK